MKKGLTLAAALAGIVLMTGHPAAAQDATARPATVLTLDQASADENIRLFSKDVRSLKKQIISANIQLTDAEARSGRSMIAMPAKWKRLRTVSSNY